VSAVIAGLVGLLVLAALAAGLTRLRAHRLAEAPGLTVLCMSFEGPRQARAELRITRPASTSDWSIRRIEWMAPAQARIALRSDGPADRAVETRLGPGDPQGRWFASDPTLWVRYPADGVPVHAVRLRLTLERAGGRRRRVTVAAVFPAMRWNQPAPTLACESGPGPWEASSWDAAERAAGVVGLA
jgi:hypothetical protein